MVDRPPALELRDARLALHLAYQELVDASYRTDRRRFVEAADRLEDRVEGLVEAWRAVSLATSGDPPIPPPIWPHE